MRTVRCRCWPSSRLKAASNLALHQPRGACACASNSFDAVVCGRHPAVGAGRSCCTARVAPRAERRRLLCLTVPAYPSLWGEKDEARGHQRRYTASELRRKLNNSGFEVTRVSYLVATGFLPAVIERVGQEHLQEVHRTATGSRRGTSGWTNAAMVLLLDCERHLIRYINLPFGTRAGLLGAQAVRVWPSASRSRLGAAVVAPAAAAAGHELSETSVRNPRSAS